MRQRQHPAPEDLICVFENCDPMLVSMARDGLKSGDIESFIFDDTTSRIFGFTRGLLVPVRLMVYAHDVVEARDCLRDLGFETK